MHFIAYEKNGQPALGVRLGNEVAELDSCGFDVPNTLDALLELGAQGIALARKGVEVATRVNLAGLKILTPLQRPSKIICIGLNYVDHVSESPYKDLPTYPVMFSRWPSSYVAHEEPILRPHVSDTFDFEGELAVVIGRAGRYIPKDKALDYVAGYTVFNDGSIREYQFKSTQWQMGKNFDATGALGPEFVTADALPPGATGLTLITRLNGEIVQKASTSDMIFDVATLIHLCSESVELRPGDVIATGTPAGVGFGRKPPVYMKHGDVCEIEIERIATLRNTVKDEPV